MGHFKPLWETLGLVIFVGGMLGWAARHKKRATIAPDGYTEGEDEDSMPSGE
jgi:hypothetical protein